MKSSYILLWGVKTFFLLKKFRFFFWFDEDFYCSYLIFEIFISLESVINSTLWYFCQIYLILDMMLCQIFPWNFIRRHQTFDESGFQRHRIDNEEIMMMFWQSLRLKSPSKIKIISSFKVLKHLSSDFDI